MGVGVSRAPLSEPPPKVLHVNDCAFVAEALCAEAARRGLPWHAYLPKPAGAHPVLTFRRRIGELARFKAVTEEYDLLHVHYGLMSYYAKAAGKDFVLHLHGTDIRTAIDQNPIYRKLVRWGLHNAARVYFSTPDLAEATLRYRPDAQWLPAPVSDAAEVSPGAAPSATSSGRDVHVLFGSRWDDIKGAAELCGVARRLRELRPELRLVTVGWGCAAARAAEVGIEVLPVMRHSEFRRLLARVDLMVGQMRCGVLGVTELEALAAGTPVVMRIETTDAYETAPPVAGADADSAAAVAVRVLADLPLRSRVRREGPEWVHRFHGVERIASRLAVDYAALVGSPHHRPAVRHDEVDGRAIRPVR